MNKKEYGVHKTHCCVRHGCKYGDKDCPVVSGEIKQEYICEMCDEENIISVDEIHSLDKILKAIEILKSGSYNSQTFRYEFTNSNIESALKVAVDILKQSAYI